MVAAWPPIAPKAGVSTPSGIAGTEILVLYGYLGYLGFIWSGTVFNTTDQMNIACRSSRSSVTSRSSNASTSPCISFFSFQKSRFPVDVYRKEAIQNDFLCYSVVLSFFPQLIAGPIVHHSEIFPQLRNSSNLKFNRKGFSIGLSQFAIGLFKKVIIADSLAQFVDPIFSEAAPTLGFSSLDYTVGVVAFSLQIYFDCSAYSDMALGLGRRFSIKLPDNFNSHYKDTSIIEFWRGWHMTW